MCTKVALNRGVRLSVIYVENVNFLLFCFWSRHAYVLTLNKNDQAGLRVTVLNTEAGGSGFESQGYNYFFIQDSILD